MLEFALEFVKWWRPSRYRGVGIRGGFVLGILWAFVSGSASDLGWDPAGLAIAMVISAGVGYRLERIGGAIAVLIFSLGFWWVPIFCNWSWPYAAGFGFVMGLVYGTATTELPSKTEPSSTTEPAEEDVPMSMICELFIVSPQIVRQLAADPSDIHDVLNVCEGSDTVLSLEKSWHGLHFVFTRTAWDGEPPLNFLVSGGVPVGDEDVGYGPARLLEPADVNSLNEALAEFSQADFDLNFDRTGLLDAEIYPQIWNEPWEELKEEYGGYLQQLKAFVQRATESGQALLIAIT
jgi:hypothetical protein